MDNNSIKIGTSGFRFQGEKSFYPKGLPQNRYIEYYSRYFDIVEINATYYSIPKPQVFERFVRLTPNTFRFTVKVPASVTHKREKSELQQFQEAILPLKESGKLHSILAQFPMSFQNSSEHLQYITALNNTLKEKLYIEFRHISWIKPDVFQTLKDNEIGIVSVDEPELPNLLPCELWNIDNTVYFRLHSKDASKWYSGRDKRYDYFYTQKELNYIKSQITEQTKKKLKALVFFNNCHQGSAMKNAETLKLMLGQEAGPPRLNL